MRKLVVIGIGAGNPNHIALLGVSALQQADAVIALTKGDEKADLLAVRQQILAEHAPDIPLVTVVDPPRYRGEMTDQDYEQEVRRWHAARAQLLAAAITENVPAGGTAAFLVWGDPSLYDSTLRIIDHMQQTCNLAAEVTVIPGITAVSALMAAHKILLNRIGEPIIITTGRKYRESPANLRSNTVVMLDAGAAWLDQVDPHTYIYWGAYLGTPMEELRQGYVHEIGAELAELKQQLRAQHGWIMDIYLLRHQPETKQIGD